MIFFAVYVSIKIARIGDHSERRPSEDKGNKIPGVFVDDPTLSRRKATQQCSVSQSSINRVLMDEGVRAWKFRRAQEIAVDDNMIKRFQFHSKFLHPPFQQPS